MYFQGCYDITLASITALKFRFNELIVILISYMFKNRKMLKNDFDELFHHLI